MFASKKKKNISKVAKIKKNDTVFVIVGKDKGKSGRVVKVFNKKGRVIVIGSLRLPGSHYEERQIGMP